MRIDLTDHAGLPLLIVHDRSGDRRILHLTVLIPARTGTGRIAAAAARLLPGARTTSIVMLRVPDAYWYEAGGYPLLPVLRIRFDDPAGTWLHVDPATGELLGMLDKRRRAYRWLCGAG